MSLSYLDRGRFRDDGFLILRGFFAPEHYRAVGRDLAQRLALLEKHHGLDPGPLDDEISGSSARLLRLERESPGAQSVLYDAMNGAPALHRLATDPCLLATVRALLSPTVALHHRFIVLMSMPGDEWHLPVWHQDWFYNRGPASTLTVWAPLQRVDAENGALLLAPGAWQDGFIEHAEHDHGVRTKWVSLPPDTVNGWGQTVSADLDVGDVLILNSLVPHSARVNRSEDVRFVVNLRYQDLMDPEFIAAGWRVAPAAEARAALARRPGAGAPRSRRARHDARERPHPGNGEGVRQPVVGRPRHARRHRRVLADEPGLGAHEARRLHEVRVPAVGDEATCPLRDLPPAARGERIRGRDRRAPWGQPHGLGALQRDPRTGELSPQGHRLRHLLGLPVHQRQGRAGRERVPGSGRVRGGGRRRGRPAPRRQAVRRATAT